MRFPDSARAVRETVHSRCSPAARPAYLWPLGAPRSGIPASMLALPKLDSAGSIPVTRSTFQDEIMRVV